MKLRPNQDSPLRKLKQLPADDRAEIYAWAFPEGDAPGMKNSEIRTRIAAKWGIKLSRDGQLSEFWPWQRQQAARDYLGAMMSQDEQDLSDKFPNLSREQIRDAVIKRGYAIADMAGDVKLALKVVNADIKESAERREWEKYREHVAEKKTAIQKELDAAKSSGGISEETREKIERELKLI